VVRETGKYESRFICKLVLTFGSKVEGFLRRMADDVDMKALRAAEKKLNSKLDEDPKHPLFQPMRRKMHLVA